MKNKTSILILLLMLLVVPTSTVLACENSSENLKTENTSCTKEDSHSEKKLCCDTEENDGCGGACDSSSCHCPSSINIPVFFNDFKLPNANNFRFIVNDWAYVQHVPNPVYLAIWQPPKIS